MQRDGGPGGAGGAGNPIGGSFTGPAEALEIIGNHAYAYSGRISVPNVDTTLLKFTTGSHYIKAEIAFTSSDSTADDYTAHVTMNGGKVFGVFFLNTPQAYPYGTQPVTLIIPPYTEVEAYMKNITTSSSYNWYVTLTGRIYRG